MLGVLPDVERAARRYHKGMVQNDDVTWVTDPDLQVTALSRRLRELLGPQLATLAALPVGRLFPDEDPFKIAEVAHEWARDGELLDFYLTWHGEAYRAHIQPLHGVSGAIVGVLGSARKIQKEAGSPRPDAALDPLQAVESLSGLGSWRTDLCTGATTWSAGLCRLLGIVHQPHDASIREFDHPDDKELIEAALSQNSPNEGGYRCDHRILRADGQTRYVQEQAHVQYDSNGTAVALLGSILDITERKIAEARLKYLAHYDSVSNLPNRALLEERLAASIARAQRSERLCALLFLDIDRFKAINDTLGHAAGDELLAAVGSRLARHVRANDTVARIGGDEFVIVLDNLASNHDAHEGARKVLEIFNDPFAIGGTRGNVTASVGVSIFPFTAKTPQELINAADAAMYVVKNTGGNGFEAARPQTPVRDPERIHAARSRQESIAR
ncbi:MAG: hypothetical protein NVSMB31_00410 [Vulcanimicrobiaceae bacterium]